MYPDFPNLALKMGSLKTQRFLTALEPQLDEKTYEQLIRCFFASLFSPDKSLDISNVDVIREIAVNAGVDKALIGKGLEAIGNDEIKAKLTVNTKRVTDVGGFGLPTTVVHLSSGPEMVFGSDRIHIVGHLLVEDKPAILK